MASWNELLLELDSQPDDQKRAEWLRQRQSATISEISRICEGRNVLFYASAFLQKPDVPPSGILLTFEEINGFMAALHQMRCNLGLTLLLHTPGGVTNAAETIADYLHSKFGYIEVIVPTYAMSAGTMLSLAADKIVMGRHSQLGPIDPQIPVSGNRMVSACAILDQFETARKEILADVKAAHLWAPVLQHLGPALLQEAQNALDYAERMVAGWLERRMFKETADKADRAKAVASYFRASMHKSHGRRIGRDEARAAGVDRIADLEANQELQDAVLTAYHVMTIMMEKSPATKILLGQERMWIKNFVGQARPGAR